MKRIESHNIEFEVPEGIRLCLVTAEFNMDISQALLDGAKRGLVKAGVKAEDVDEYWVPGSVELPLAALTCAKTEKYDAIICLGAIIKGETDHYNYVARMVADGIRDVNLRHDVPTLFGVLTCQTLQQAKDRSQDDTSNTGYQVALSALKMINVLKEIRT